MVLWLVARGWVRAFAGKPKYVVAAMISNIVICAAMYAFVEDVTRLKAVYASFVAGSTTGFGDVFPKTGPGQLIMIYVLAAHWFLDKLLSAILVVSLIQDPDGYSDKEQKTDRRVVMAMAIKLGIDVKPLIEPGDEMGDLLLQHYDPGL